MKISRRSVSILCATLFMLVVNLSTVEAATERGDVGNEVRYVQQLLSNQGYLLDKIDGAFGNNTEYAVKEFQRQMNLKVTGKVDDKTLARLEENNKLFKKGKEALSNDDKDNGLVTSSSFSGKKLKFGDRNPAVGEVQERLNMHGFSTAGVDSIFGHGTENAVRSFQRAHGLDVTGEVDNDTREELFKDPKRPTEWKAKLNMVASAYSAHDPGNGSHTANGNKLRRGLVAVDPDIIPLGTDLYIEGYGYAIADDTGGAIQGNHIDLAMDTREEALIFGRQDVVVYILK